MTNAARSILVFGIYLGRPRVESRRLGVVQRVMGVSRLKLV